MTEAAVAAVALLVGFLSGHNFSWRSSADDEAVVAKIAIAARNLRFKRRFLTAATYPTWEAEFVTSGETYLIELRCIEDRGKRPVGWQPLVVEP